MNKRIYFTIVILIVALFVLAIFFAHDPETMEVVSEDQTTIFDPRNCTYQIEGEAASLKDGQFQRPQEDSSSPIITNYFGQETFGDFNNDGFSDQALLLTQDSGGSGTFFYVVVALNSDQGCQGTNAVFLGDRIAPQNLNFTNGQIVVNYADRNLGEAMTIAPSLGVSRYFQLDGESLMEVQN